MNKTIEMLELNNMNINTEEDFNIYQRVRERIQRGSFMWDL